MIRALGLMTVFVLPLIVVSLPGLPQVLAHVLASSMFIFFLTGCIFWFGLSPKSKMIRGGKLSQPEYDTARPRIEWGMRAIVVLFGTFYLIKMTLPFTCDLIGLGVGESPGAISGIVVHKSVPLLGLWFIEHSVRLSRDGPGYYAFYSFTPLRIGHRYQLVVLPRSRVILNFHESGASGKEGDVWGRADISNLYPRRVGGALKLLSSRRRGNGAFALDA